MYIISTSIRGYLIKIRNLILQELKYLLLLKGFYDETAIFQTWFLFFPV